MRIGFVGLGAMGAPLAEQLLGKGALSVFDLNSEVVERFAERGAMPARSLSELAEASDLVLTCLPSSREVRHAIFHESGLAAALAPGSYVVDMTTGDPAETRAMAAELARSDITLLDAPVSGGPHGARAGTIAIIVGAPPETFTLIRPILERISPNIFHCGDVGTGHALKLINNMIAAVIRLATFEGLALGVKNGLSIQAMASVLAKGSARSSTTEITLPRLLQGDIRTNFSLGLMMKDLRLATDLGMDSAVPLPVTNLARELFSIAMNDQGAQADINMILKTVQKQAGVTILS